MRTRAAGRWGAAAVVVVALVTIVAAPSDAAEVTVAAPSQRAVISFSGSVETIDLDLSASTGITSFIFPTPAKATVTVSDPALFSALDGQIAELPMVEDDWWGRAQPRRQPLPAALVNTGGVPITTSVRAADSKGLSTWLTASGLTLSEADKSALAPYAKDGWSYSLLKFDPAKPMPTRIQFATKTIVYPVRLQTSSVNPTTFRFYVFGAGRTELRQSPRTSRDLNAARVVTWAGPVTVSTLKPLGAYLTVTDLRFDKPGTQATTDLSVVPAAANDELIPSVVVYRPIKLLSFPLGWLLVVWGAIGVLVGLAYLRNRFRAH